MSLIASRRNAESGGDSVALASYSLHHGNRATPEITGQRNNGPGCSLRQGNGDGQASPEPRELLVIYR